MSYSVSLCHPMLTRSLGAILARVGYHNDTVLLYGFDFTWFCILDE